MLRYVQKCLEVFKKFQQYSKMSKNIQKCPNMMIKIVLSSKNCPTKVQKLNKKRKVLTQYVDSPLAKHRLTHSEERRYHCNICGKAFKRQDHLNGHLLTHRSTKPFACHVDGCGKSYCDARSLRRHKENHHGQAKPESKSLTSGLFMSFSEQF